LSGDNICGASVQLLDFVAFLERRISKWLRHFWKIFTPLAIKLFQLTSQPRVTARGMRAAIVCLINFDLVVALCLNRIAYLRKQE
jgi:hypothetical protein